MMMNGRESGSGRLPGGRAGIGHSGHLFAQLVSHIARLVGRIARLAGQWAYCVKSGCKFLIN